MSGVSELVRPISHVKCFLLLDFYNDTYMDVNFCLIPVSHHTPGRPDGQVQSKVYRPTHLSEDKLDLAEMFYKRYTSENIKSSKNFILKRTTLEVGQERAGE